MTTQTKTATPQDFFNVDVDAVTAQVTEAGRKATNDYLDLVQKTTDQLADLEVKSAQATKLPAVVTLAETHASVSRDLAGAYVSAVRDLLKA